MLVSGRDFQVSFLDFFDLEHELVVEIELNLNLNLMNFLNFLFVFRFIFRYLFWIRLSDIQCCISGVAHIRRGTYRVWHM